MAGAESKRWLAGVVALLAAGAAHATPTGEGSGPLAGKQGGLDALPPQPEAAQGRVVLQCTVNADRSVSRCLVLNEQPKGHGLGDAALRLYQQIRLSPETFTQEMVGQKVEVPIDFARDQEPGDMPPTAAASPPGTP